MVIQIMEIKEICRLILKKTGITDEDIEVVFNHLLEEELLGKISHGFYRLRSIVSAARAIDTSNRSINIKHVTSFASKITVENTLGLVAAKIGTDFAINKAIEYGFSMVALTGYKGTSGALGYYSRMFAKNNLISIILCTSEFAVAPWGGKDAILGTNPIAISIPNNHNPIIIDCATSAMSYGDLMIAAKQKREVPFGIVLDKNGNPSTDPMDAENGCQLPMAGHKGFALGLAVEIIAGLLIGAKSGKDAVSGSDGFFIIAFKPDLFITIDAYYNNLAKLIEEILYSHLANDSKGIRIPGENCFLTIEKKLRDGKCEILNAIYEDVKILNEELIFE